MAKWGGKPVKEVDVFSLFSVVCGGFEVYVSAGF